MIQKTRWYPDTCACVLEYEWDDSLPAEERVHIPCPPVFVCDAHDGALGHVEHHAMVVEENGRKNKTVNAAAAVLGSLQPEQVGWDFDKSRNVVISLPKDLDNNQKALAHMEADRVRKKP